MSYGKTEIDPDFREAIVKASANGFVRTLYDAFDQPLGRYPLAAELGEQSGAVARARGAAGQRHGA
jgi:hypothetical protein